MYRRLIATVLTVATCLLALFNIATCKKKDSSYFMTDFIIKVENGKTPIVLQITDTQIIDSSQQRNADRLGDILTKRWAKDKKEEHCYRYVRQIVQKSSPDLIIITGDIIYGEFDDDGSALIDFINFMDSLGVPWAPVFGNHEAESKKGIKWQCEQFEKSKYCLFKTRELTGFGNYSVGIVQGDELLRVFYMMDSNGGYAASESSLSTEHYQRAQGFGQDQIDWCAKSVKDIKIKFPDVKLSLAYHIPMVAFSNAFLEKYNRLPFDKGALDLDEFGKDGDFGYLSGVLEGWDENLNVWKEMKNLGFDSMFVGHLHQNSASIMYEGVRLQFGLKSSTYDSVNYINEQGEIVHSFECAGSPIIGGTVIPVSCEDGSINPYHLLYEES